MSLREVRQTLFILYNKLEVTTDTELVRRRDFDSGSPYKVLGSSVPVDVSVVVDPLGDVGFTYQGDRGKDGGLSLLSSDGSRLGKSRVPQYPTFGGWSNTSG